MPSNSQDDRGSQYLSIRYTERLVEAGVEPSVGSVGDPLDWFPSTTGAPGHTRTDCTKERFCNSLAPDVFARA